MKNNSIPVRRAIGNNLYALKLAAKLCKKRVIMEAVLRFFGYFEWIFYSAFFMRYVIDAISNERPMKEIFFFLAITVAVFGTMSVYSNIMNGSTIPTTNILIYQRLYERLFRKARNVELACFEDASFYNRYTLALDNACENLLNTVGNIFGIVFGAITGVVAFSVMFSIDPWAVLFVIFPILGNFLFNNRLSQLEYRRNKEIAPHKRTVEYINRVLYLADYAKEVRLTNVFSMLRRKYEKAIEGMAEVTRKYTKWGMFLHWMRVQFTFTFIFEGVLLYGAYRTIVSKSMTLAQLAVLSSVMVTSTWILIGFADSLISSFKNGLFVENLRGFMEYKPVIPEDYAGEEPPEVIESIEFCNVSFSYKEEAVVKNLSFRLKGGQSYAMVGHNGAGKSTVIKLLMRLYDPTEGEIRLNGKDIRKYNLKQYRNLFATAFQDYKIFSLSVTENVVMHKERQGDREIAKDALKRAGVYEKVRTLSKGMDTVLTKEFDEEGTVLSGGEFQKIGVARAFAREVPIKIFDEPSSALDPIAEYELFENMLQDSRDKTMLFISHRLSSVQNADWVFLLENGKVAEQGTHKQLMELNGIYADMYRKQAQNYLASDTCDSDIFNTEEVGSGVSD